MDREEGCMGRWEIVKPSLGRQPGRCLGVEGAGEAGVRRGGGRRGGGGGAGGGVGGGYSRVRGRGGGGELGGGSSAGGGGVG